MTPSPRLFALSLCLAALLPGAAEARPRDIDGDGRIDARDVQIAINASLGLDAPFLNADITADGRIDALDLQIVINAALGIPTGAVVPHLEGMPEEEARAALATAGLGSGAVTRSCHGSIPAGCVAAETPPAGTLVDWLTPIDLVVSLGPEDPLAGAAVGPQEDGAFVLPTTQRIAPAGQALFLQGRPSDLAVSPDGLTLAVRNRRGIDLLDVPSQTVRQRLYHTGTGAALTGIVWKRDGQSVWVTDADGCLRWAARDGDGAFAWAGAVQLPGPDAGNPGLGGLALDEDGQTAYVCLSRNNALAVVDLAGGGIATQIPVGIAPYAVLVLNRRAYVTNWGGRRPVSADTTGPTSGSLAVVDPETGIASTGTVSVVDLDSLTVTAEIPVGLHPTAMAASPDGARLYVANANADTVSVIDARTDTRAGEIEVKPDAALPFGSGSLAVAVSPDGATLFVALATNNCVAVVDLATERLTGLIPTGWYPSALALIDGTTLAVANSKGVGCRGTTEPGSAVSVRNLAGSVSFVALPDAAQLAQYTRYAAVNMRLPVMARELGLPPADDLPPAPARLTEPPPFKHVLYIIKENRTYDQIFGDMSQGDGDPSLCLFGRDVTPNHHALAEEFVLFDNFYCNGTMSPLGHQWTDAGYGTDYLEKGFDAYVRSYPFNGGDCLAYPSSGFIWDAVLRKGLSFRDYGEFAAPTLRNASTWSDVYTDFVSGARRVSVGATARLHTIEPYLCPAFAGFNGKVPDVQRASAFEAEFHAFEQSGRLPNFMIMLLPNDHTCATTPGFPTPRACVADNDLALGRIVEIVSHSRFWPDTAIFVIEDDPGGGLDHVDGHRTVALCISPYTKRGYVDSSHYNQTGLLRTFELIFDLPPLNQLTLGANPLLDCFQSAPDLTPYFARPNAIPLDELNPPVQKLTGPQREYALKSLEAPLDELDEADEHLMLRAVWHSVRGFNVPCPERRDPD